MLLINSIGAWLKAKYDKIIALIVFLALAGSLAYLAVRIGMIRKLDQEFDQRLESLKAKYPEAESVTPQAYETALAQVQTATSLSTWTNDLSVPEMRVWCIDCRRPIRFAAMTCRFCGTKQPDTKIDWLDTDGDGISDGHETKLGLDPRDPEDAGQDLDGDGFSNKDEFEANKDIRNKLDHPSIEPYLHVSAVDAIPFQFLFKSYMKWSGDSKKFAINTRDDGQTYLKKLGEDVDGFVLHSFERKVTKNDTGPSIDHSVLTLKKGDRLIPLVKGAGTKYDEYTVHFDFDLDGSTHTCKLGGTFKLREEREYELIHIDSVQRSVVIRRIIDEKEFTVAARNASSGDE